MSGVSEIIDCHKSECEFIRKLLDEALRYRDTDFEKSKELLGFANIFAATVAIVQESERFNHGITDSSISYYARLEEELVRRALHDNGET